VVVGDNVPINVEDTTRASTPRLEVYGQPVAFLRQLECLVGYVNYSGAVALKEIHL